MLICKEINKNMQFKIFSLLNLSIVNIDRYNLHKPKVLGALGKFYFNFLF